MILAAITQQLPSATPVPMPGAAPEAPPIRDIAPPLDVFPYPPWMVAAVIAGAVLLLAVLITALVFWLRRRPAPPPPLPRVVALRELEALRGQVRTMDPYEFSIVVSDVLRTYLGLAYRLHAREQTSPEFLADISSSVKFNDDERKLLAEFLERADMIKFARVDASTEDSQRLLESAMAVVQGGRP